MAKTTKKAKQRGNVRKLILCSIINYMQKYDGRSPTLREIGDDIGIQSLGHISHHLKGLEETYYIQRDDHKSRSIKVLKNWNGSSLTNPVAIAAGPKRTIMSAIVREEQLFPNKSFLLPVEGNSMIGDSIFGGDLLIVDPDEHIKDGDIVVATHLDFTGSELGAATVKHVFRDEEGKQIRLQPSNSEMSPIYVDSDEWDSEWQVQGKVIGVIHQFA
ncbi:MAG TPA: transcriptional repressor LexA [Ktedonobacteraceae bacterium]